MTDANLFPDRLALLIDESPDRIAINDLLSSLEHSLEVATQLGFNDTCVLVRAARSRAVAEIVDRFY